ncbi:hypothetical protein Pcinc_003156 [Petrolisthes cinctipes]|uniref:Peptidase A2 domain-containing protein n=1 Tax=Petrolisthes cinctipes TaxID=88211 RepID=A0AAE1GI74_PETCI|nr:hypothetical protein Pcinc_003156 [Petrolisthes cinctipes]
MPPTLHTSGKRDTRSSIATAADGHTHMLLYISDRHSGRRFLVDSGAEISVVPPSGKETRSGKRGVFLILAAFPDVVKPHFYSAMPKHGVLHHIPTTGPPLHARPRRLPPDKLAQANEEFRKMEEMGIVSDPWSARQQRHLAYISEYTTHIQHLAGKTNKVADALSRTTINALEPGIDYKALAEAQK